MEESCALIRVCNVMLAVLHNKTLWPSGLRRYVKAVVFTGVGSNPIEVNFLFFRLCWSSFILILSSYSFPPYLQQFFGLKSLAL